MKRKRNPAEEETKKGQDFPWLGVAAGLAGLTGLYFLFKPSEVSAATSTQAQPTTPTSTTTPATTPPVVTPTTPTTGSSTTMARLPLPAGSQVGVWGDREFGPILQAYLAKYRSTVPVGSEAFLQVGGDPNELNSLCVLAQSVPFYSLNQSDYKAAVFFVSGTDVHGPALEDEIPYVTTQQCAQAIASQLVQRGIVPVFMVGADTDRDGLLMAAVAPVGGTVVRVQQSFGPGVTIDQAYETAAADVYEVLFGGKSS